MAESLVPPEGEHSDWFVGTLLPNNIGYAQEARTIHSDYLGSKLLCIFRDRLQRTYSSRGTYHNGSTNIHYSFSLLFTTKCEDEN